MISRYVNRVLDRAEQLGWWVPLLAGANIGLALIAIRPAGTSLRRRLRIRQLRREIAESKKEVAR